MFRTVFIVLMTLLPSMSFAADLPTTEEQKTLYAIGLTVSQQLSVFNLTSSELAYVVQGIVDAGSGKKPAVELSAYSMKIQDLARIRRKILGEKQASANKEYLEKAAKDHGAVKTESGLVFISLKEGSGNIPKSSDTVKVNYRGTLTDGKEFDSTYKRGAPQDLKLDQGIKCLTEGLQKMRPGGKARLICPSSLAYGERGVGDVILPGAVLVFEVELIETMPVTKTPPKVELNPAPTVNSGVKK